MEDIQIRILTFDELDACAAVIRQSFATVAADFGLTEQNCPANGAFIRTPQLEEFHRKGTDTFGLYTGGVLAGVMQLWETAPAVFELGKLAVLPRYRHAGYSAQLLAYARDTARSRSGRKITIGIIEENTVLKSWYEKHGFVHTGTTVFPHLPFTVGFMELAL